ncbi:MAG: hypothetical protein AAF206_20670 [Bacteroidota bacterium]
MARSIYQSYCLIGQLRIKAIDKSVKIDGDLQLLGRSKNLLYKRNLSIMPRFHLHSQQLAICLTFLLLIGIDNCRAEILPIIDPVIPSPQGCMVRITGKLIEKNTGYPLSNAEVTLKFGKDMIARKTTDQDGNFIIDVSKKEYANVDLQLSIRYMDHVFYKRDIRAEAQKLNISINGKILIDGDPVSDYKLPIHTLSNPKVGKVDIKRVQRRTLTKKGESEV